MRAGRIYYDAPGQRVVVIEEEFEEGRELYAYTDYFFHKEVYIHSGSILKKLMFISAEVLSQVQPDDQVVLQIQPDNTFPASRSPPDC